MYVLQGKGKLDVPKKRGLLPPTLKYINNPTLGKFCFKENMYVLQGKGKLDIPVKRITSPYPEVHKQSNTW